MPTDPDFKLTDMYEEFFSSNHVLALFEGAQGFGLDIDWGDYPYVTSSSCTVGGAIINGIPPKSIRKTYGIAKAYQTYVGAKKFQPDGEIFDKIREIGMEYGATTGRPRQVNYLDLDFLVKSANVNGVSHVVINKTDILQEVNEWKMYKDGQLIDCKFEDKFKDMIKTTLLRKCEEIEEVIFSYSAESI